MNHGKTARFFRRFRVFKRIFQLEQEAKIVDHRIKCLYHTRDEMALQIDIIANHLESREPCKHCGKHRYTQETQHVGGCNG